MSALAVYLERAGIATTVIGLVRLHLEKIRPPRALWVSFELGRPLGPPNDAAFQTRVLRAALGLLAHQGPQVLSDFDADDPNAVADPAWSPPPLASTNGLRQELAALRPLYTRAVNASGRTTVGVSGIAIDAAADYIGRYSDTGSTIKPDSPLSAFALLRFACDDLKAYCLEAASVAGGRPSSAQLCDWFWQQTQTAAAIRRLRQRCLDDGERKARLIGNSLVPRAQL